MLACIAVVALVAHAAPPRDQAPGAVHAAITKLKASYPDEIKAAATEAKPSSVVDKAAAPAVAKPADTPKLKVAKVAEASKPVEAPKPVAAPAAKPKVANVVARASADAFPEDWMKSSNILKYDIDSDPMGAKIESQADDTEKARAFNLKHVELLAKKKHQRTAMEFLYVDDSEQSPGNDHCPACGDLVCPHGFTAQAKKNHCCPYCVNPSVSTEVVKDPAWYAAQADPVMKKFR